MDAPHCIVCNTKHWSRQPCPALLDHGRGQAPTPELVKTETPAVKTETVRTTSPVKTPVKTETEPVKTAFDKKAWMRTYMKDYMRQRRATLKATSPSS
jgi:hypothetical protein